MLKQHQESIKRRGLMFVISAASGTGKTTLSKKLIEIDSHLHLSISATTRAPRPGEVDGVDYHFISCEQFRNMVENGEFLEYAEVFGNFYGTPKAVVESYLSEGEDVLFDIDWQGHRQLIASARDDVASVFILPPAKADLMQRLQSRKTDSIETINYRMDYVNFELSHWHEYDYNIINRILPDSVDKLYAILRAERLKRNRRTGLPNFVAELIREEVHKSVSESIGA